MKYAAITAFSICGLTALCATAANPTRLCNDNPWQWQIDLYGVTPAVANRIKAVAANPTADPQMAVLLGNTRSISWRTSYFAPPDEDVILQYPVVEDVAEIADRIRGSPAVFGPLNQVYTDGVAGCFAVALPPVINEVTEYYNTVLNHYFLSSSVAENNYIESGKAGAGWVRTGESWKTYAPEFCASPHTSKWVYRFYGTPGIGSNSHFFTAGPQECGMLRNGTGWTYEGTAFGAELPVNGSCPANAPRPVYRLYNMRWAQNDSNHRHTPNFATYLQMMGRGWAGEGIAFCIPDVP